jgi:hypothetical protein
VYLIHISREPLLKLQDADETMSDSKYSSVGPVLPDVPVVFAVELEKTRPLEFKSKELTPVNVPPTMAGMLQTVTLVRALLACFKF